jgi:hypothetical protein
MHIAAMRGADETDQGEITGGAVRLEVFSYDPGLLADIERLDAIGADVLALWSRSAAGEVAGGR